MAARGGERSFAATFRGDGVAPLADVPGCSTGQAGVGVDVCLFTQEIDERPQRWADMPTTRVVKKEPIEWWRCPIFEYGCELTLNKEWLDIVMMGLQEAQSILRSFDR